MFKVVGIVTLVSLILYWFKSSKAEAAVSDLVMLLEELKSDKFIPTFDKTPLDMEELAARRKREIQYCIDKYEIKRTKKRKKHGS